MFDWLPWRKPKSVPTIKTLADLWAIGRAKNRLPWNEHAFLDEAEGLWVQLQTDELQPKGAPPKKARLQAGKHASDWSLDAWLDLEDGTIRVSWFRAGPWLEKVPLTVEFVEGLRPSQPLRTVKSGLRVWFPPRLGEMLDDFVDEFDSAFSALRWPPDGVSLWDDDSSSASGEPEDEIPNCSQASAIRDIRFVCVFGYRMLPILLEGASNPLTEADMEKISNLHVILPRDVRDLLDDAFKVCIKLAMLGDFYATSGESAADHLTESSNDRWLVEYRTALRVAADQKLAEMRSHFPSGSNLTVQRLYAVGQEMLSSYCTWAEMCDEEERSSSTLAELEAGTPERQHHLTQWATHGQRLATEIEALKNDDGSLAKSVLDQINLDLESVGLEGMETDPETMEPGGASPTHDVTTALFGTYLKELYWAMEDVKDSQQSLAKTILLLAKRPKEFNDSGQRKVAVLQQEIDASVEDLDRVMRRLERATVDLRLGEVHTKAIQSGKADRFLSEGMDESLSRSLSALMAMADHPVAPQEGPDIDDSDHMEKLKAYEEYFRASNASLSNVSEAMGNLSGPSEIYSNAEDEAAEAALAAASAMVDLKNNHPTLYTELLTDPEWQLTTEERRAGQAKDSRP